MRLKLTSSLTGFLGAKTLTNITIKQTSRVGDQPQSDVFLCGEQN